MSTALDLRLRHGIMSSNELLQELSESVLTGCHTCKLVFYLEESTIAQVDWNLT